MTQAEHDPFFRRARRKVRWYVYLSITEEFPEGKSTTVTPLGHGAGSHALHNRLKTSFKDLERRL